jgi:hypothetical protein
MAEEAQRRVVIRVDGKTYGLSSASTETVLEKRKITKQIERHGAPVSRVVTRDRDERVTLVLSLKGSRIPDEIEFDSSWGPTTIYSEKVALAK